MRNCIADGLADELLASRFFIFGVVPMRAVVLRNTGGVDVLRLEEAVKPRPGPRDVLIRVAACGVCFLDVVTRNGTHKKDVELPCIPGHEIAGVVEDTGTQVKRFKPGERVATTQRYHICGSCRFCRGGFEPLCPERRFLGEQGMVGGYADYVAVEEDNVALIPEGVTDEQASIAACAIGTLLNAVRDVGKVAIGERVLVTGAGGGLGVHAVQMALLAGAYVIAQTTSPDKAPLLSSMGAHEVVVSKRGEDFSRKVRELTSGEGADVLLDNVGTPLFSAMRRSLGVNGRWILIGQVTGDFVPFNPAQLFLRNQSMLSVHSTTRAQLEDCLALIARGAIRPVVSAVFPLSEIQQVHRRLEDGGVPGRLVVRPGA
ncbi:MAG: zinc-binding alcohol dehydrogenase family protein [Burkholderiales bacterium]